jgi:hypothetical protein
MNADALNTKIYMRKERRRWCGLLLLVFIVANSLPQTGKGNGFVVKNVGVNGINQSDGKTLM